CLDPRAPFPAAPGAESGRLLALYEIGRQLLEPIAALEVLETVRRAIVTHLAPDLACIVACAADGSYRPLSSHNIDTSGRSATWPLSHTVLRRTRETGMA